MTLAPPLDYPADDVAWKAQLTFYLGGTPTISNRIDFLNTLIAARAQKLGEDQLAADKARESAVDAEMAQMLLAMRQLIAIRGNELEQERLEFNERIGLQAREVAAEEKGAGIAPGPAPPPIGAQPPPPAA